MNLTIVNMLCIFIWLNSCSMYYFCISAKRSRRTTWLGPSAFGDRGLGWLEQSMATISATWRHTSSHILVNKQKLVLIFMNKINVLSRSYLMNVQPCTNVQQKLNLNCIIVTNYEIIALIAILQCLTKKRTILFLKCQAYAMRNKKKVKA